jgi:hypothetical protein
MLARDLDVLDRDPNVDFVAMDFFSMIMSAHRVQNDYGLGQRFRNDIPDATGERFIDVIAAHVRRASKPFFAIVSAAETERDGARVTRGSARRRDPRVCVGRALLRHTPTRSRTGLGEPKAPDVARGEPRAVNRPQSTRQRVAP